MTARDVISTGTSRVGHFLCQFGEMCTRPQHRLCYNMQLIPHPSVKLVDDLTRLFCNSLHHFNQFFRNTRTYVHTHTYIIAYS